MMEPLFIRGGWVMLPILALSVYALAIIFYKITQFVRAGLFQQAFVAENLRAIQRGELSASKAKLEKEKGPIARVMATAITCLTDRNMSTKTREAEIARVGTGEIRALETHMRGLELVYTTAPLIGLLGTVLGMVTAFSTLASAGARVDPSMLAGGIWQALITTVGGLCVAIPAVAAYYMLDGVIERARATMRDVTVQILALDDLIRRNELPVAAEQLVQQSLFAEAKAAPAPEPEIPDTVASHIMVEKIAEYPPAQAPLELSPEQIVPPVAAVAEPEAQPPVEMAEAPAPVQEAAPAEAPVVKKPRKPKKPRRMPAAPAESRAAPEMAAAHAAASNPRLQLLSPTYNKH